MRGSPISCSSSGRSPLPQGSRVTLALTPLSLVSDHRLCEHEPDADGLIRRDVVSSGLTAAAPPFERQRLERNRPRPPWCLRVLGCARTHTGAAHKGPPHAPAPSYPPDVQLDGHQSSASGRKRSSASQPMRVRPTWAILVACIGLRLPNW